jgi:excisionase family DNA binding protein
MGVSTLYRPILPVDKPAPTMINYSYIAAIVKGSDMKEAERTYTTPEAAHKIGISAGYLREMIADGRAQPAQQVGGTWLFTLAEIERLKSERKSRGRPPKK